MSIAPVTRPAFAAASVPTALPVYVASPVNGHSRAAHWRSVRASGVPITSSWINEETALVMPADYWRRVEGEIAAAVGVVLCVEDGEVYRKEPLMEAAMALGMGKYVAVLLYGSRGTVPLDRSLGSWLHHPRVSVHGELQEALSSLRDRYRPHGGSGTAPYLF